MCAALGRLALAAALACGIGAWSGGTAVAQDFAVAGTPLNTVQGRDYGTLFRSLRQNKVSAYFPTFQYEEVPAPKSLGYETDFQAPCTPDDPAFAALRASGMKLILAAELIYPDPGRIGRDTGANDPLQQIIACAGREHLAAITTYDEAAFHGIPESAVRALYDHVKGSVPDLPVLMVHGPIITDKRKFRNNRRIGDYLEDVVKFSAHADVVGFDVYPVPAVVAKVATPLSGGDMVDVPRVVQDYTNWLKANVPNKQHLMVLQGFGYADLYEPEYLRANVPQELRDIVRAPNVDELTMMVEQARANGVDLIIWWGGAALRSHQDAPWPGIMQLARRYGR